MTTRYTRHTAMIVAALASVITTGVAAVALDRSHAGTLPRGTVEVGELQPLAVGSVVVATLPAVEVIGYRTVRVADTVVKHGRSPG